MLTMSLFVTPLEEWKSSVRMVFLKRALCHAHAKASATAQGSGAQYAAYKPMLVLWALVDKLQVGVVLSCARVYMAFSFILPLVPFVCFFFFLATLGRGHCLLALICLASCPTPSDNKRIAARLVRAQKSGLFELLQGKASTYFHTRTHAFSPS